MAARGQLIAGAWDPSHDKRILTVENPARREAIAEVPRSGGPDVDRAVAAAAAAFPCRRKVPPREREFSLESMLDSRVAQERHGERRLASGAIEIANPEQGAGRWR